MLKGNLRAVRLPFFFGGSKGTMIKCKCGVEMEDYLGYADRECPWCVDKRLGKKKVLTLIIDKNFTIHAEFRNKEECKDKAISGIEQMYKQYGKRFT